MTNNVNLPNRITFARLLLSAIFVAAASFSSPLCSWVSLITFILAAISDFLDGYLARKMNLVTSLGKLLDPLADKILVCSAFVILSAQDLCPAWVTCLILAREFLITGLRQIAVEKGAVLAADNLGKWKTTLQLVFIITCLTHISFSSLSSNVFPIGFFKTLSLPGGILYHLSLWSSLALTMISGFNYSIKAGPLFKD